MYNKSNIHDYTDDPLRNLANAIILQAVDDWMTSCNRIIEGKADGRGCLFTPSKDSSPYTFASLRRFFKSGFCEILCGEIDPAVILEELERRRVEAVRKAPKYHERTI